MKEQKGFSVVEFLLIVVVLGLIGGTSWYVYRSQRATKQSLDNANSNLESLAKNKKSGEQTLSDKEDWLVYTNTTKSFKLSLPNGTEFFASSDESSHSLFTHSVIAASSTKAVVKEPEGGSDNPGGLFINYQAASTELFVRGEEQTSFKTYAGIDVKKYYFVQTEEPDGIDLPKGGKEYLYVATSGDKKISILYTVTADQKADTERVEEMIKTVVFNP